MNIELKYLCTSVEFLLRTGLDPYVLENPLHERLKLEDIKMDGRSERTC